MSYFPNALEFFICTNSSYKEIKLYQAVKDKANPERLVAAYFRLPTDGDQGGPVVQEFSDLEEPYFPSFYYRKKRTEEFEYDYKMYLKITRAIDDELIFRPSNSILITELENILVDRCPIGKDYIQTIIKLIIAETVLYKYKANNSGEFIYFSDSKASYEKSRQYYGSLADELKIKSDKIGLLVSHKQTVGNYREYIFRELLRKHIPSKFSVATGFIEGVPMQIDIIVYDSLNHAPSFREGDLVVVRLEAVRAIIEVKTNLTSGKLKESLEFFYSITKPIIFHSRLPIFKGVFAFDSKYENTSSIAEAIKIFYNEPYFEEQLQKNTTRDILYLHHEISCVTVLKKHCLFSSYEFANGIESDNQIPKLFSMADQRGIDVQTALFIALLHDYLDVEYYGKFSMLKAFSKLHRSSTVDLKLESKLTNDDWVPRNAKQKEHFVTKLTVDERLARINNWFDGTITTTELVRDYD